MDAEFDQILRQLSQRDLRRAHAASVRDGDEELTQILAQRIETEPPVVTRIANAV